MAATVPLPEVGAPNDHIAELRHENAMLRRGLEEKLEEISEWRVKWMAAEAEVRWLKKGRHADPEPPPGWSDTSSRRLAPRRCASGMGGIANDLPNPPSRVDDGTPSPAGIAGARAGLRVSRPEHFDSSGNTAAAMAAPTVAATAAALGISVHERAGFDCGAGTLASYQPTGSLGGGAIVANAPSAQARGWPALPSEAGSVGGSSGQHASSEGIFEASTPGAVLRLGDVVPVEKLREELKIVQHERLMLLETQEVHEQQLAEARAVLESSAAGASAASVAGDGAGGGSGAAAAGLVLAAGGGSPNSLPAADNGADGPTTTAVTFKESLSEELAELREQLQHKNSAIVQLRADNLQDVHELFNEKSELERQRKTALTKTAFCEEELFEMTQRAESLSEQVQKSKRKAIELQTTRLDVSKLHVELEECEAKLHDVVHSHRFLERVSEEASATWASNFEDAVTEAHEVMLDNQALRATMGEQGDELTACRSRAATVDSQEASVATVLEAVEHELADMREQRSELEERVESAVAAAAAASAAQRGAADMLAEEEMLDSQERQQVLVCVETLRQLHAELQKEMRVARGPAGRRDSVGSTNSILTRISKQFEKVDSLSNKFPARRSRHTRIHAKELPRQSEVHSEMHVLQQELNERRFSAERVREELLAEHCDDLDDLVRRSDVERRHLHREIGELRMECARAEASGTASRPLAEIREHFESHIASVRKDLVVQLADLQETQLEQKGPEEQEMELRRALAGCQDELLLNQEHFTALAHLYEWEVQENIQLRDSCRHLEVRREASENSHQSGDGGGAGVSTGLSLANSSTSLARLVASRSTGNPIASSVSGELHEALHATGVLSRQGTSDATPSVDSVHLDQGTPTTALGQRLQDEGLETPVVSFKPHSRLSSTGTTRASPRPASTRPSSIGTSKARVLSSPSAATASGTTAAGAPGAAMAMHSAAGGGPGPMPALVPLATGASNAQLRPPRSIQQSYTPALYHLSLST